VNVVNHAPHGCKLCCFGELIKSCICILRVEVPDGNYMLVPTDEDKGARRDVYYLTVEQDPDQSSEGYLSACADEGKPRFNH
jgi:hypothetical protein